MMTGPGVPVNSRPRQTTRACRDSACSRLVFKCKCINFALVSANAAFAFALAFDCPDVGAFAFALESKTFAFALAFDSNAFDWIQMPIKCDLNVT